MLRNVSFEIVSMECVTRYFEVILYYKKMGYKVAVWGPIASWHDSKKYTGGPSFGDNLERNKMTRIFNTQLSDLCDNYDVPFLTFFYNMVDDEGLTKPEYLDDWEGSHIHLNQTAKTEILNIFKEKELI